MGYSQADHPLPRIEPPWLLDTKAARDALVTVRDFGARGNRLHDETVCFAAYNDWFRRQLLEPNPQRVWKVGGQGFYWLTETLDWTNFEGVTFDCHQAAILSKVRGVPAVDARGTSDSTIKQLYVESYSYPEELAMAGMYIGGHEIDKKVSKLNLDNISISGNYSMGYIVNFGVEYLLAPKMANFIVNFDLNLIRK